MSHELPNRDLHKALFLNLVTMLSMSALQQLGKIINPLTGKAEVSLEGAQATIDTLDMLEVKTRGQRDADEEKALQEALLMLKMNFVESRPAADQAQETPSQAAETPAAAAPAPSAAADDAERKELP